jgi:hypothetical protein
MTAIALCIVLGFTLGIITALVLERRRLRAVDDVRRHGLYSLGYSMPKENYEEADYAAYARRILRLTGGYTKVYRDRVFPWRGYKEYE